MKSIFKLSAALFASLGLSSVAVVAVRAATPAWLGNPQVHITRATSEPCEGRDLSVYHGPAAYDDWARQRAAARSICFEAWVPGVTDQPSDGELSDLQLQYRFDSNGSFSVARPESGRYVKLRKVGRRGNNFVYSIDLAGLDPFYPSPLCLKTPVVLNVGPSGPVRATMEFLVTLGGNTLVVPGATAGSSARSLQVDYYVGYLDETRLKFYQDTCKYTIVRQ